MTKQIAYRFLSQNSRPWYVSEVKGDGGVDWGYTDDVTKAKVLNTWYWKQFAKDMRDCGTVAFALQA
jgi:hypothetical protein